MHRVAFNEIHAFQNGVIIAIRTARAHDQHAPMVVERAQKPFVAEAKRLRRASPKTGDRLSYRQISARLEEAGFLNERGRPFNPKSVRSMLAG
jgi:site-specific recombinase XerC